LPGTGFIYPTLQLKTGSLAICLLLCLINFVYIDSCQTSYRKIYRTDLCQIFTVGRTMAVDDQSEIVFLKGGCHGSRFLWLGGLVFGFALLLMLHCVLPRITR